MYDWYFSSKPLLSPVSHSCCFREFSGSYLPNTTLVISLTIGAFPAIQYLPERKYYLTDKLSSVPAVSKKKMFTKHTREDCRLICHCRSFDLINADKGNWMLLKGCLSKPANYDTGLLYQVFLIKHKYYICIL